MDADGFTRNWTTVDPSNRILNHICLGGADLEVALGRRDLLRDRGQLAARGGERVLRGEHVEIGLRDAQDEILFGLRELGVGNFSVLVSHVTVPPAMTAILTAPTNRVQGFLAAGHVCSVMGTREYGPLVERFGVPIVVTGFEPLDLLEGVRQVVELLEDGKAELRNAYPRAVSAEGNTVAQQALADVFTVTGYTPH